VDLDMLNLTIAPKIFDHAATSMSHLLKRMCND